MDLCTTEAIPETLHAVGCPVTFTVILTWGKLQT